MKKVLTLVALVVSFAAGAQSSDKSADKAAAIKALIESENYIFKPTTVLPITGQSRQLTYDYSLTITSSKIVSDLPYYGRAFAPVDPTKGGMNFVTKVFDYSLKPRKKGGWDVVIKPKDLKDDIEQMYLTISVDGYATLRVISMNRDAISYNGSVASPQ